MRTFRFALIPVFLLLSWALLHIPVGGYSSQTLFLFHFHADEKTRENSFTAGENTRPGLVYYRREVSENLTAYRVQRLSRDGHLLENFKIPVVPEKVPGIDIKQRPAGDGYLSAPDDGAFFIWYPQLGSYVFLFDSQGKFLWQKQESRYLQVYPGGDFLIAAAGDHSRVQFLKPDFVPVANIEGNLMLNYQLAAPDMPAGAEYHGCMVFIDGMVAMADLENSHVDIFNPAQTAKSVTCDLNRGAFLVQVEVHKQNAVGQTTIIDQLQYYQIKRSKTENKSAGEESDTAKKEKNLKAVSEPVFSIDLPGSYPVSLPLAWHPKGYGATVFFEGKENYGKLVMFDDTGEIIFTMSLKPYRGGMADAAEYRAGTYQENLFIYNSDLMLVMNKNGLSLLFEYPGIELVKPGFETLFMQNKNSVTALVAEKI